MAEAQSQAVKKKQNWQVSSDDSTFFDPLLASLVILTKIFGRAHSEDSLRAGLPLENGYLTPALFVRAAERAGLSARLIKRPFKSISSLVTPAVLLLEDQTAIVLVDVNHKAGAARIIIPEAGDAEKKVSIQILEQRYSGYAFFIKEQFRYDKRTAAHLQEEKGHWFWNTLKGSWKIYRDVLFASLLINIFVVASPLFVMNVYDRVVPNQAFDTLWVLAVGAIIVFSFDFLLKMLRSYFIDLAGKKSDILLSAKIFSQVLGIKMSANPTSVGSFAKNLQEFESIRDFITSTSITAVVDLPFVVIILLIIAVIAGPLVWIPVIGIIIIGVYGYLIQAPLRDSIEQTLRTSAQKNATLIESLTGLEALKIARAESEVQYKWEQAVGNIAKWGVKTKLLSASAGAVATYVQQMSTVGIVALGVYLIAEGEVSMGGLIATVMLAGRCLAPMAQVASLSTRYNQAKSAFMGLNEVMKLPGENPDDKRFVNRPKFEGNIDFDRVSFAYPNQQIRALNSVSFKIKTGEKVAIIGRIGSGKTTIEKLILGLYQPDEGAVRIDGIDLRQVNPSDLRHNIGCVPQDIVLFYGSVKDNISLGAHFVDDAAIIRAAEIAGVADFANKHPDGLDLMVGERGSNLSGGQRQSIALARAILLDPPILLLDEPSSSMDNTSEMQMKQKLMGQLAHKTLVLVTHKASLLELVDRLIVVDQGKIVADGPKELVHAALREGKLKIEA
ncbi:type I secretion system permease/ATPase [Spartinivicinus poritis]|uniref:Type I secretion system permease/ATPase n=1 Tax=Spartinivicinus poritis TaxID=2994640 RepID=A0ABT5UB58_9GAMM|nr:type I secretion system permease/ATPase [Spartinivicinus sp. A2-2]MDE1463593.1 type I secretion system permease/ATPase [Spartinivicinus sp. A2-2]